MMAVSEYKRCLTHTRSFQEAGPVFGRWKEALGPTGRQAVSVSRDQAIDCIANYRWNDSRQTEQLPWPTEVRRHPQRGRRVGEYALGLRTTFRLHEQNGVELTSSGMSLEDGSSGGAIEGGEAQRALAIVRQDELDAFSTEAAGAVVEQQWCVYRRSDH